MDPRLEELARRLRECRRKGNRMTLQYVLESAKILKEARERAKRDFSAWVREKGRMDPTTARHHLRVSEFVDRNRVLTPEIVNLSIAKVYALTTLDLDIAQRILKGQIKFSQPLEELTDIQFRIEFRKKFPPAKKRRNRQHAYQQLYSDLVRATRTVYGAEKFRTKFTLQQRRNLNQAWKNLIEGGAYLKMAI